MKQHVFLVIAVATNQPLEKRIALIVLLESTSQKRVYPFASHAFLVSSKTVKELLFASYVEQVNFKENKMRLPATTALEVILRAAQQMLSASHAFPVSTTIKRIKQSASLAAKMSTPTSRSKRSAIVVTLVNSHQEEAHHVKRAVLEKQGHHARRAWRENFVLAATKTPPAAKFVRRESTNLCVDKEAASHAFPVSTTIKRIKQSAPSVLQIHFPQWSQETAAVKFALLVIRRMRAV